MNQQQAAALVMYLNRAISIIPTTGVEWSTLEPALKTLEDVANGRIEIRTVEPKGPQAVVEKDTG